MIDETVLENAHSLVEYSKLHFREHPKYVLDFSWPSIGLLDLFLNDLRFKKQFCDADLFLIRCGAAYLGCVAHDVWNTFHETTKVELYASSGDNKEDDILLLARGGPSLPKRARFEINLSKTIQSILQVPERPFPFFSTSSWPILPSTNIFSLLGLGVCSGLSPYGNGPWAEASIEACENNVRTAMLALSATSADYYRRCFPGEELGASAALYETGLIYPPPSHGENYIFSHAIIGLTEFFSANSTSHDDIQALAFNLALSPDESISSLGFILAAALSSNEPPPRLRALSESFGERILCFLPALILARARLGMKDDWPELLRQNRIHQAKELLRTEIQLGFVPLWRLGDQHFEKPQFYPLFAALRLSDSRKARKLVDSLLSLGVKQADLLLQGIYLDICHNDCERAYAELEKLTARQAVEANVSPSQFLELVGLLSARMGDTTEAADLVAQALILAKRGGMVFKSSANTLAHFLMTQGRFDEAETLLSAILKYDETSVKARFNRYLCYKHQRKNEQAVEDIIKLARLIPMDRQIFSELQLITEEKSDLVVTS